MSKSLKKFQTFLQTKNILIKHIVCEKENIIFLISLNETLHEFLIISINPQFGMTKKDIDINVDVIQAEKIFFEDSDKEYNSNLSLSYEIKEIDENLRDDSQVIKDGLSLSNYKQISINNSNDSAINQYRQFSQQLEKFKECVKNLRYKFSIFSQEFISYIDRSNEICNIIIKQKECFIPVDTVVLCISIDIENLFESIDTFVEDSVRLYSSFYNILSDAHRKQILALDSQIKLITDVPKQIDSKKKDLANVQIYLNNVLQTLSKLDKEESKINKLIEFENRKKAVEQKDIKNKDQNITKLRNELYKILNEKEKNQTSLSTLRKTYHQQLLGFDYNVYKGLQLFHSMTEKIKKVL
jgi:hypothetical protein